MSETATQEEEETPCVSEGAKNSTKGCLFVLFCLLMAGLAGTIGAEPILDFLDWVIDNKVAGAFIFLLLYIPWLV